MSFSISPAVTISEVDLTTVVPAIATTVGAIAGPFRWGPCNVPQLVDSELTLKSTFGSPDSVTANTWFTAASFLAYTSALQTVRIVNTGVSGHKNATADGSGLLIQNEDDYLNNYANGQGSVGDFAAKWPGDLGNSIGISMADQSSFATWKYKKYFTTTPNTSTVVSTGGGSADELDLVVYDSLGYWTGTVGTVLETFPFCSKSAAGKNEDNTSSYYAQVLNRQSKYVWWMEFPSESELGISVDVNWGGDATVDYQTMSTKLTLSGTSGTFTVGETVSDKATATITPAGTGATATAAVASGSITSFTVTAGGSGYVVAPTVVITPNVLDTISVVATGTATVSGGHVTAITVGVGGTGYAHPPTISFTVPGTGATASVTVNALGVITALTATAIGSAYASAPTVTISGPGTGAVITAVLGTGGNSGKVVNYTVVNGGTGYSTISGTVLSYASSVLEIIPTVGSFVTSDVVTGISSAALGTVTSIEGGAITISLSGGVDGNSVLQDGDYEAGYDYFASPENINISLLLGADADSNLADYLISDIALQRLDCVVFLSPPQDAVVNNVGNEATDIIAFRNLLPSTSYAVMDSGWKYMYDKYNDVYRWVPLNGDIAGLCARTDQTNDPWWSPAGYNRGNILNIVKLAYNPRKTDRDELYSNSVNPVISQPGQGTVLFGDKTMLTKPSAFDRINVRRLFIVLEKSISTAANYTLFEFNDTFTRAQFVNMVTPFLRTVQSRRGIFDYTVVCDSTNNTPDIIDADEFVGDIYIKPARSINFIQLNFIAVSTGVAFSEVVGKTGAA